MMRMIIAMAGTLSAVALLATTVSAQTPSRPATQSVSPEVERILDRLEQAGNQHRTLKADVTYVVEDPVFLDKNTKLGQVYYHKDPTGAQPTQFRISFQRTRAGDDGAWAAEEMDYAFDGFWLITRNARLKQMVKYQVVRPGERTDPMALGEGRSPFPVPFGQEKAEVLRLFHVETGPLRPDAPKEARDYIVLTPRPEKAQQMSIRRMQMWVDEKGLPVKIVHENPKDTNVVTVLFANIQSNIELPRDIFRLPRPPQDWDYQVKPLEEAP